MAYDLRERMEEMLDPNSPERKELEAELAKLRKQRFYYYTDKDGHSAMLTADMIRKLTEAEDK